MSRLSSIGTNPTIRNFARDASQAAIRKTAQFLAPTVEVPTRTGKYKIYDAKNRYKRANTKRAADGGVTVIGFTASDANYGLEARALDFKIPEAEKDNDEGLLDQAKYGAILLADAAGLDHEAEVINTALATLGAGTDVNFEAAEFDAIDYLNHRIVEVKKLAKNGAKVRILLGMTAELRIRANKSVIARFNGVAKAFKTPSLDDLSSMLVGNPEIMTSEMVQDVAPEGKAEDIQFLLDDAIIIFACNDTPNTMDPSFMKTFRLMGKWMTPGSYQNDRGDQDFLKMDWNEQIVVTNAPAAKRINAKGA